MKNRLSLIGAVATYCITSIASFPSASGSTYVSTNDVADAFVTSGSSNNANANANYGGTGALMVAGSASGNGTFETLIKFDLSGAKSNFDTLYGVGNWSITNVTITLRSNFGIQGAQPNNAIFPKINTGGFSVTWMTNDSWTEGAGSPSAPSVYPTTGGSLATDITFNNLAGFQSVSDETLGSFTYTPPGNNTNQPSAYSLATGSTIGFLTDISNGSMVSLLFAPTDTTVSYLFDSRSLSSGAYVPSLSVSASAVPEPRFLSLLALGMAILLFTGRRNKC